MADDVQFTMTGLDRLRAMPTTVPAAVEARTKGVALSFAQRVLAGARERLQAQTHGAGNTASALEVSEDAANRRYVVRFGLISRRPANLPNWLEYGTVRMPARPFMHPAADAVQSEFASAMADAAIAPVREALE